MRRMIDRGAGAVRPEAGGGLLGGVVLGLGPGKVQRPVLLAVPDRGEVCGGGVVLGRGRRLEIVVWRSVKVAGVERSVHTGVTEVVVTRGQVGGAQSRTGLVGREGLRLGGWSQHVRVVGEAGGVSSVGQAVLEPGLDHVVVVQPAVGLHHHRLLLTRMTGSLCWEVGNSISYLRI